MAQIQTLKDRTSDESVYPTTSTQAVIDTQGRDLETRLAVERTQTDNSLKDYAKTTDLTEGLAAKQDKLRTSDDLFLSEENMLSLTQKGKMAVFIDMWIKAGATHHNGQITEYDPTDKLEPFVLNKIRHTYDEALQVFSINGHWQSMRVGEKGGSVSYSAMTKGVRTLFPVKAMYRADCSYLLASNNSLEYVMLGDEYIGEIAVSNVLQMFTNTAIRKVEGGIDVSAINVGSINMFLPATIEDITINKLRANFIMDKALRISLGSVEHMISNAINTSAITIIVHSDVYAKLTGDTTNEATAALTAEEFARWQQVLTDAAAKNISFATT